ncbi:MAG: glycosyltransferase family 2 protein, partial [Akkermansia sp.]
MSNSPAISIIIPVFRVRDYIHDCVSSVISQDTKLDIEIILVDDCGGDDSIDIARQVLNKAPSNFSSKIIRNKCNKGVSFSRN